MSKLDDVLNSHFDMGFIAMETEGAKQEIKKLILDLFKECEYEPFEFVDRVSKL